jgi:hypothetical protein
MTRVEEIVTSERAEAYGRVMKTLADLATAKLHEGEAATLREAADSLLFCNDLSEDAGAHQALAKVGDLCVRLEEAERLTPEALDRLLLDIQACGPAAELPLAEPAAV